MDMLCQCLVTVYIYVCQWVGGRFGQWAGGLVDCEVVHIVQAGIAHPAGTFHEFPRDS